MLIVDWNKYIKSLLPTRIRGGRLVALISALLGQAEGAHSSTNAYIADARLRSAITPQVCWLQKVLADTLGYTCTITEADGLPVDFNVNGVHYADLARAHALLERYKLAGRSYQVNLGDITASAAWADYRCERTLEVTASAAWGSYVCVRAPRVDTATWGGYVCATAPATLHVENSGGDSIVGLKYDASGTATNEVLQGGQQTIGTNPPYVLYAPETDMTIVQSSATIGSSPEPANANCTVTLLAIPNSPYTRALRVDVGENSQTLTRSWTFTITCGTTSLELTVEQDKIY